MRIVLIPSAELSYNSGSVIYAKMLFEYLLNSGNQVYMLGNCVPEDINEEYKQFVKVGVDLLFHPIIDDREISDVQYMKMYTNILTLITDIYEEWSGIDVVHAHYASINSYAALYLKKFLNVPFVVSSFGRDINIGFHCDERIKAFICESMPYADWITVSEDKLKEKIVEYIPGLNRDKITTIPMPLDDRIFSGSENVLIDQKGILIISSVNSCFTPEKGIEDVLMAFAMVSKKMRCELYIAGQDDDENKVNYKRICKIIDDLGISDIVHLLGYLSRGDVGKLLKMSDLFIDARYKGNFSSVLLESQFQNCVTIASDNAAAKKIICDGENGMLFPIGDVNCLAKKIADVFCNEKLYNNLKNGMKKWCDTNGKEYRREVCMKRMVEVFYNATR